MNKAELIEEVATATELPKTTAAKVVEAVLGGITSSLTKGEEVSLPGVGTLVVKKRAARAGRNPKTGETIQIPASKVVGFKASKVLKEAVNSR